MATKYIIKDTILMGYSDSPYSDGVEISDAPPEFNSFTHICKRIDDKWVLEERDLTEWNATQYQRDRAVAYDPIPEQLDQIYWDMDGWKKRIKAVKDKYPKP
tara:strand:- start:406 stop:711 length:306 start_codon:yes stop_codon:yes gene_type:complete